MSAAALTPAQVAELAAVSTDVVLAWLRSGVLRGFDAARPGCSRPRWRIDAAGWEEFKLARRAGPGPRIVRRRRREVATVEFY